MSDPKAEARALMKGPADKAKEAFVDAVKQAVCDDGSDADADVVAAWLDAGARLEWLNGAKRDHGLALPCVAAYFGKLKVLKLLASRAKGAKLELDGLSTNDMTGLAMVIQRSGKGWRENVCSWSAEAAGLLLDMGAGLETTVLCKQAKSDSPMVPLTPLQVAARYAKMDACEVLVKRGAKKDGAVATAVAAWLDKGQGGGNTVPNAIQIPDTISKLVALGCPVTVEDFKALLYKETSFIPDQKSLTDKVRAHQALVPWRTVMLCGAQCSVAHTHRPCAGLHRHGQGPAQGQPGGCSGRAPDGHQAEQGGRRGVQRGAPHPGARPRGARLDGRRPAGGGAGAGGHRLHAVCAGRHDDEGVRHGGH